MSKPLLPLLVAIFLSGLTWAEEPVHFTDLNLKAAVEEALWISDPTATDMLGLTSLTANDVGISDLTGLEHATNLVALELTTNRIGDISILSGLTNLEVLILNNNQIGDMSVVAGLDKLEHLDIHHNEISDMSPVAGLMLLHTVILRINQISDISPLSLLSNLEYLDIRNNQISDISPLSGLSNLRQVDLLGNSISDISPLCGLTNLSRLELQGNPLNDEACDICIPQILANNPGIDFTYPPCVPVGLSVSSGIGGSVREPGEGEFTFGYMEVISLSAKADPGFVFTAWSGSSSCTENPTFITMDDDHWIRADFLSTLDVLHVDDDGAGDPGPGDATLSDPQENGTPEHPFDSIQEAIEVAAEGTTIIVQPGTYRENIDLLGKNVHLTAMDPNDPTSAPYPVIEGTGTGPVVTFSNGEGPDCLLTGFVITKGKGKTAGAILCDGTSPTIRHCLIVGNRATDPAGAAIYCQDSQAVLTNCTIADNYAGPEGAALVLIDSDVTVLGSILWNDRMTNEILAIGTSDPNIQYCGVRGWWPDWGNIHKDPLFARPGVWIDLDDPDQVCGPENPAAILETGDYHLKSQTGRWAPDAQMWVQDEVTSPCIDAGLRTSSVGSEPAPNGGRINMGAYGGTTQASNSYLDKVPP